MRLFVPFSLALALMAPLTPVRADLDLSRTDPSFAPVTTNGPVTRFAEIPVGRQAGTTIVTGSFTAIGDSAGLSGVARLGRRGGVSPGFRPPVLNPVVPGESVEVFGAVPLTRGRHAGKVMVYGNFVDAGGRPAMDYVIRLRPDGTLDRSFVPPAFGLGTGVIAVAEVTEGPATGDLLVGGGMVTDTDPDATLLRLDPDGAVDSGFQAPDFDDDVEAIVPVLRGAAAGRFVVAGPFSDVSGTGRNVIVRLRPDGSLDPTFTSPDLNPLQADIDIAEIPEGPQAGDLMVWGLFGGFAGIANRGIARLSADGSLDTGFRPLAVSGPVFVVQPLRGTRAGQVLAGGFGLPGAGAATQTLTRITARGSVDPTFTEPAALAGMAEVSTLALGEGPLQAQRVTVAALPPPPPGEEQPAMTVLRLGTTVSAGRPFLQVRALRRAAAVPGGATTALTAGAVSDAPLTGVAVRCIDRGQRLSGAAAVRRCGAGIEGPEAVRTVADGRVTVSRLQVAVTPVCGRRLRVAVVVTAQTPGGDRAARWQRGWRVSGCR